MLLNYYFMEYESGLFPQELLLDVTSAGKDPRTAFTMTVWCLVGNGGRDPYDSSFIVVPITHFLLRTRRMKCVSPHELRAAAQQQQNNSRSS